MIAGQLGDPLIAKRVLAAGCVAVPRLEQRDHEFRQVRPVPTPDRRLAHVALERVVALEGRRMWQVSGKQVEEGWHVGGPLDRGVAAQRNDADVRTSDVADPQLESA